MSVLQSIKKSIRAYVISPKHRYYNGGYFPLSRVTLRSNLAELDRLLQIRVQTSSNGKDGGDRASSRSDIIIIDVDERENWNPGKQPLAGTGGLKDASGYSQAWVQILK